MPSIPDNLLAVETSSGLTSIAFWDGQKTYSAIETEPNKQAERILPMTADLLAKAGKTPNDIKAFAATLGPGGFTGIRIGLSAITGMKAVLGGEVYGVSTTELAAFAAGLKGSGTIVLNALRGQLFVQPFKEGIIADSEIALVDIPKLAVSGPVITNCPELVKGAATPALMAESIIGLLKLRAEQGTLTPIEGGLTPIYVRPPDAKLPQKKL